MFRGLSVLAPGSLAACNFKHLSTFDATAVASLVGNRAAGKPRRKPKGEHEFDADLVVIGGGSGGLACAREASKRGAAVIVLDAVSPSPQGTTWGLGGTCVNVGCIPKKLMHQAGLLGTALKDAKEYGWQLEPKNITHDWDKLRDAVQDYIHGTNWGYKTALRQEEIEYINGFGSLIDPHTVKFKEVKGSERTITGQNIVIAVGGRPAGLPHIPDADKLTISSDDLFSLGHPPGKTLVIGAGYVALECAGLLTSLGYSSSVMMRSIPLRGFDSQMAGMVVDYMERHGTRFIRDSVPVSIEESSTVSSVTGKPQLSVSWKSGGAVVFSDVFDTVMVATGRHAVTQSLNLTAVGVKTNPSSGKVIGREGLGVNAETSTVDSVFAIGDCLDGKPELTPSAIRAGRLLAGRLFPQYPAEATIAMNYTNVATTVFTPLEYACVGLSEDAAVAKYGADDIEVYHLGFDTLEMAVAHRTGADGSAEQAACYVKAVCLRPDTAYDKEKVLGLHLLGPGAGDVMQGFAVAMSQGLTIQTLTSTVGIHPTLGEEFVLLDRTKRSGVPAVKTSC